MVSLRWREDLNVGIDFIDTDHEKLVELIIELSGLLRPDADQHAALDKLDEIIEFTRQHFRLEERLMVESAYAQYEHHKRTHEKLLHDIVACRERLAAGEQGAPQQTMEFLERWLMDHIIDSDKDLGLYLTGRITQGDDQQRS